MNVLKYFSKNYEVDERTYINKVGDIVVISYKPLSVGHNASGLDSWVVLIFLVQEMTDLVIMKTARGLILLSFLCEVTLVNTVEVPQYIKLTCTKLQRK